MARLIPFPKIDIHGLPRADAEKLQALALEAHAEAEAGLEDAMVEYQAQELADELWNAGLALRTEEQTLRAAANLAADEVERNRIEEWSLTDG